MGLKHLTYVLNTSQYILVLGNVSCISGLWLLTWLCDVSSIGICLCCGFRREIVSILMPLSVQRPERVKSGFLVFANTFPHECVRLGMFS